jgi:ABC-type polysaccharide/polyol phosphate export permease
MKRGTIVYYAFLNAQERWPIIVLGQLNQLKMVAAVAEVVDIVRHRELLRNLVLRDIKIRYKRSVLGFLWVMLNPVLTMLVLSIVFATLFRSTVKDYTLYVLSGLVLWLFFAQSTSVGLKAFVGNSSLITTVALPKSVFPLAAVVSALVNLVLSALPLFGWLLVTGRPVSRHLALLPVAILEVFVFACGVALILSTVTVFFQDMTYIYDVLLLAWMYLTPIFYPVSIIPEQFAWLVRLNPLVSYLQAFRACVYMESATLGQDLGYGLVWAVLALIIGWTLYHRYKNRIVYHL